jgi:hypothetical protein
MLRKITSKSKLSLIQTNFFQLNLKCMSVLFLVVASGLYMKIIIHTSKAAKTDRKEPIPKIGNKYSQKRNFPATVPISTFMCL